MTVRASVRVAIVAGLLSLPTLALAQESDPAARLNGMIASKLGALEIANASLTVQLGELNARIGELQKMCGDRCKPKAPEAKP